MLGYRRDVDDKCKAYGAQVKYFTITSSPCKCTALCCENPLPVLAAPRSLRRILKRKVGRDPSTAQDGQTSLPYVAFLTLTEVRDRFC